MLGLSSCRAPNAEPRHGAPFYAHLLSEVGVPFFAHATILDLQTHALRSLKHMDVKLLMLDEVHNILAGSAKEQRILLNALRYISNELKVSLVCWEISEAHEAMSSDARLARRFEELQLTRWQGNEAFQALIFAILRHLPLKLASQISSRALRHVLQSSDGVTA